MSGGGARGWGLGEADGEGTGRGGGDLGEGGFGNGPGALGRARPDPGTGRAGAVRTGSTCTAAAFSSGPCSPAMAGVTFLNSRGNLTSVSGILPEQWQVLPAGLVSPHEDPGLLQEQLQGCPAQVVTSEPHLRHKPQFKASSDP